MVYTIEQIIKNTTPIFQRVYRIYGHIHNNFDIPAYRIIKNNPKHFRNAFNAGIDVIGYTPRTLDELIAMNKLETEENNEK